MQSSLNKLKKIFQLEAQRQYDNRAVMGGIEKMLHGWEAEARAEDVNEPLIKAVTSQLRNYDDLEPEYRALAIKNVWQRIQHEVGQEEPGQRDKSLPKGKLQREKTQLIRIKERPVAQRKPEPPAPKPETRKTKPPKRPKIEGGPIGLNAPTTVLNGVGTVNAKRLEKLGISTLGDMLYHFPRRYDDFSQLTGISSLMYGNEVTIIGTVRSVANRPVKGKRSIVEAIVDDGSGALRVTWFNQPWMARNLSVGNEVVLAGKVDQFTGRLTMNNPEWELLDKEQLHTNRIVPVYPLAADVGQRWLRGLMMRVVSYWAPRLPDPLPQAMLFSSGVMPLSQALLQVHFPESKEALRAARQRLAFDELLMLQLAVLIQKKAWQGQSATRFEAPQPWLDEQIARLPFALTHAQTNVLADLLKDLNSGRPMNRLLQGDVGSGKTVVAAICMATVARQEAQAALMAPTSILAEQHYVTLQNLMVGKQGLQAEELRLIMGSTPESEKKEIRQGLHAGKIKIVVGTHTLIEDPVLFAELEMIIIDEQHRFGVSQRAALRAKGTNPHLLVMTATPIPRSLALTLYGDLDLSVIGEMPPGRREVSTSLMSPTERQRAYDLIRREVDAGRQAFIIYPLIEESDSSEALSAVEEEKRLRKEVFPDLKLKLLHGRMPADEKEKAMAAFRDAKAQVLVSTTVIEVGVDIPNATVMLIEGADRFGLAQLHQLRGRVGRGAEQSYCVLVPSGDNAAENERLKALLETNDGFMLAEKDLEQRGPGQFLGGQQSGFLDFRLASLTDGRLIDKARRHAEELLTADPVLSQPDHRALSAALKQYLSDGKGDLS
ncbi:MAG: ATP-dependent DNA helicase RecG [Anaerolineales bacterium]